MKNLENTNCSRRERNRLLDCKQEILKIQLNFKSQKKSLTHYNVVKGANGL